MDLYTMQGFFDRDDSGLIKASPLEVTADEMMRMLLDNSQSMILHQGFYDEENDDFPSTRIMAFNFPYAPVGNPPLERALLAHPEYYEESRVYLFDHDRRLFVPTLGTGYTYQASMKEITVSQNLVYIGTAWDLRQEFKTIGFKIQEQKPRISLTKQARLREKERQRNER